MVEMRRISFIALTVTFILLLVLPVADAKVIKTYDDVSGAPVLYSSVKLPNEPWEVVAFWKTQNAQPTYALELHTHGYKEWIFFAGQLSVKSDGVVHNLGSGKQSTKNDWPNVVTTTQYAVSTDFVDAIAKAQPSSQWEMQLQFQDRTYVTWKIPAQLLKEWQDVILKSAK
jgi:hypothetical protein